jgi:hypothetical protein
MKSTQRIHDSDTFCRMVIRSNDAGILVDLAVHTRRIFRRSLVTDFDVFSRIPDNSFTDLVGFACPKSMISPGNP